MSKKTEILYMPSIDSVYIKEFEANVIRVDENGVVLDRTAFYPEGGGQLTDLGVLVQNGKEFPVKMVKKRGDKIMHVIDGDGPSEGPVTGILDWERRYAHMKMHTAQHVVSAVAHVMFGASTAGNQIHAQTSRIDLEPFRPTDEELEKLEEEVNKVLKSGVQIEVYTLSREEAMEKVDPTRVNLSLLPEFIKELRMVDTKEIDICPCAGTHVKNTSEIGTIKIIGKKSKGKGRTRITYELIPPGQ